MRFCTSALSLLAVVTLCVSLWTSAATAQPHGTEYARDGSGVYGYRNTPVQPWSGFHVHDPDRPEPPRVKPGDASTQAKAGTAPSDAVVLFDGRDMSRWNPAAWKVEGGELVAGSGALVSKQEFGDCQLHVEWLAPVERQKDVFNDGNNGVQFLRRIEVQIFDSHTEKLYPDGQAASVYAQTPPLVNACRKPGEWQTYDIVFTAPRFDESGAVREPARITMFHNGLLVHLNQEVYGHTPHKGIGTYAGMKPRGPITLLAHSCPVRFRNVWVRSLEGTRRADSPRQATGDKPVENRQAPSQSPASG